MKRNENPEHLSAKQAGGGDEGCLGFPSVLGERACWGPDPGKSADPSASSSFSSQGPEVQLGEQVGFPMLAFCEDKWRVQKPRLASSHRPEG